MLAVAEHAEVARHAAVGVDRDPGQDLLALLEAEALHVEVSQADPIGGVGRVLAVVRGHRLCEALEVLGDLSGVRHGSGWRVARVRLERWGTTHIGMGCEARVPSQAGMTVRYMDERKLLNRLARGAVANVAFSDLCSLVEALGFELRRVSGSHHVFTHPDIPQLINLQSVGAQAKPYQIRQLMRLVERYDLKLRNRP